MAARELYFTRLVMARLTASRRRLRFSVLPERVGSKHSRLRLAVKRKNTTFSTVSELNPYQSTQTPSRSMGQVPVWPRWPVVVVACMCSYYALSALTLPWADAIWFGEFPPLAIIQLPKSFLKSMVQDVLMFLTSALGRSRGSFSLDYISSHGWAMGIMAIAPALLLAAVIRLARPIPYRRKLIALVLVFASMDGVVTIWFDSVSNFKIFNASYF